MASTQVDPEVEEVPAEDAWWVHEPYRTSLRQALEWAASHPPAETDLHALMTQAKRRAGVARTATKKVARQ